MEKTRALEPGFGAINKHSKRSGVASAATRLMRFFIVAILAAAMAAPARAGEIAHVIELFTSQGCSSCPPADRLLAEMAGDKNTVALSFPVDIWDYIGWKDTFASPLFTARQQAYARARGDGRVYTPQVVVDGVKAEVGSDRGAIARDVASARNPAMAVPMTANEEGGYLHVAIGAAPAGAPPMGDVGVYILRVVRSRDVEIGRGENSGHRVTYTNVVRAMSKIGDWAGRPLRFDMLELKADDEGYVVLLQAGQPDKPAVILAAAKTAGL